MERFILALANLKGSKGFSILIAIMLPRRGTTAHRHIAAYVAAPLPLATSMQANIQGEARKRGIKMSLPPPPVPVMFRTVTVLSTCCGGRDGCSRSSNTILLTVRRTQDGVDRVA